MKGYIVTNPFDKSETQQRKVRRMTEEFGRLKVQTETVSNDVFLTYISGGDSVTSLKTDFVLFFDKDKYSAQLLEKCGVRVFNKASATAVCDDKMQTHIALCNNGINMPKTLSGALCYLKDGKISDEYLNRAVGILGLPMVVKQCFGSYGEQVYLVNTRAELEKKVNELKNSAYLFQEFVKESCGRDMRVIVIGGKAVCGMIRRSENDFRSNTERGGIAESAEVPKNIAELCEKAANIIGLDYCGVDVLLGKEPQICEVNSNAMFFAMERATGVNVARAYAEHIVYCVKNGK